MKYSNDTIGNRTRDFPACSAVPQPTAPSRARKAILVCYILCFLEGFMSSFSLSAITVLVVRSRRLWVWELSRVCFTCLDRYVVGTWCVGVMH